MKKIIRDSSHEKLQKFLEVCTTYNQSNKLKILEQEKCAITISLAFYWSLFHLNCVDFLCDVISHSALWGKKTYKFQPTKALAGSWNYFIFHFINLVFHICLPYNLSKLDLAQLGSAWLFFSFIIFWMDPWMDGVFSLSLAGFSPKPFGHVRTVLCAV